MKVLNIANSSGLSRKFANSSRHSSNVKFFSRETSAASRKGALSKDFFIGLLLASTTILGTLFTLSEIDKRNKDKNTISVQCPEGSTPSIQIISEQAKNSGADNVKK